MIDTMVPLDDGHDLGASPLGATGRVGSSAATDELRDTLQDPLAVQVSEDPVQATGNDASPPASKRAMERAFGQHDPSAVKAHTGDGDASAAMGAGALSAAARVAFGGAPAPEHGRARGDAHGPAAGGREAVGAGMDFI